MGRTHQNSLVPPEDLQFSGPEDMLLLADIINAERAGINPNASFQKKNRKPATLGFTPQPQAPFATFTPQPQAPFATFTPQPQAPFATFTPQPQAPFATFTPQPQVPPGAFATFTPQPQVPPGAFTTFTPQPQAPIPQARAPAPQPQGIPDFFGPMNPVQPAGIAHGLKVTPTVDTDKRITLVQLPLGNPSVGAIPQPEVLHIIDQKSISNAISGVEGTNRAIVHAIESGNFNINRVLEKKARSEAIYKLDELKDLATKFDLGLKPNVGKPVFVDTIKRWWAAKREELIKSGRADLVAKAESIPVRETPNMVNQIAPPAVELIAPKAEQFIPR